MPNQKRLTAYKVRISDILNSNYVRNDGWNPNYFLINNKKVSRVNIIAVVVSPLRKENNFFSFDIDDGSGSISIRDFEEKEEIKTINVGDVILIIGKPKEFGSVKYIIPEIIKKIDDKKWLEVRKKELEILFGKTTEKEKNTEKEEEKQETKQEKTTPFQKVYDLIKKLDKGQGVSLEQINIPNAEKIINSLLLQGEIYEIKPGRYKLL